MDSYKKMMEAQIAEWDAEIRQLRARAKKARARASLEYEDAMETLERKLDQARAKLKALSSSGEEAWGELKHGLEVARADVEAAIKRARARLESNREP